jgi:hypothetical protein
VSAATDHVTMTCVLTRFGRMVACPESRARCSRCRSARQTGIRHEIVRQSALEHASMSTQRKTKKHCSYAGGMQQPGFKHASHIHALADDSTAYCC